MPNDPGDVRNFGAVFDETARVEPTRIAIIDTSGRTLSYGDFAVRVARTANALDSMGVSERDRVALLYQNGVEYLVATLAVARVGAIPVPVTPKLSAEKLRFVLDDCGARLMLVADRQTFSGSVASAITQADSVTTVALHTRTTALYLDNTNVVLLRDRIDDMVSHGPAVVSASDPAMQPYTSGSTGRPRPSSRGSG
jgi:acyl-CoA synthetase (AMP-forming)/AMP-acid ligase II